METIQLICMQLQHAIHLDVNQNQFSCQNKKSRLNMLLILLSGEPGQILYTFSRLCMVGLVFNVIVTTLPW